MTIRGEDKHLFIQILTNPEKYGYKQCEACKGYGGDNRCVCGKPHELCAYCGGDGVIFEGKSTCSILEEMGVKPVG